MSKQSRRAAGVVTAIVAAMIMPQLLVSPAHAASTTTIAYVGESTASVAFGADWSFAVQATGVGYDYEGYDTRAVALGPTSGTVSVTVSGVGGTFASGIPIQADGRAYISQPIAQPLLPAGEYQITAIFVPAGGTDLASSQTATPATLTVTPLGVSATAAILSDPSVSDAPFIEASLSGDYLAALGGTPPGTWSFSVKDGDSEVFAVDAPQKQGADAPVRVEITEELRAGRTFTLASTFTPTDDVVGGIELTAAKDAEYTTPGTGLLDAVTTRVPFPTWLMFTIGGVIIALVITVVILGVKLSRRNGPVDDTPVKPAITTPAAAQAADEFESAPLSDFGLDEPRTVAVPAAAVASRTEVGSWSLSADAPTEAISQAELDELAARPERHDS